nr:hypothetical protein [Tanacetum cinerariifolium]
MCDVHLFNNPTPLEAKDHFEIVMNSNDDISSNDDDSLYEENIEYVEASPHNSELVSLDEAEIVIPEVEEIKDDILREKLLNVHLLIANIKALKDNPTPSSELLTKSSSTFPKSFLDETNTFHNSLPEFENFYFDLEEISSGSTTTHYDISLPDYEAFSFDDDHIEDISSGGTTTHSDISVKDKQEKDKIGSKPSKNGKRNSKGGKISGKGKIKTGKLDFDDVYFVKELKFNLFSVSHMCDKKNSVLFTDTECVVLSSDYKLPDENHVLLQVSKENNMYNVDLKNVVPSGGLTCLFAKATLDESNIWHKRLGHINFKTMNKLVKGNLVRGLPSKIFENNHTCVACQKGKQHRASYSLLPIPLWAKEVNNACYVQNKVLVTKPHNKTPYKLLLGRSPSIGFMRPFRCPVTILNTIDLLEKFDGKADEGFLVGYSVNCKAFRGLDLIDIDTLTMSMNYQPVYAGNQPNAHAGIKENIDAGKVKKEIVSAQQYMLLPLKSTDSQDPKNINDNVADDAFEVRAEKNDVHVSSHKSDKTDKKKHDAKATRDDKGKVNTVSEPVNAVGPNLINNTTSFNTASPSVNVVSPNFRIAGQSSFMDPSKYHDDPDMPELEDIVYLDAEEDVGAEADLSNLETHIPVTLQTRSMTRMVKEQGGLNQINDEGFHTFMLTCFLSQEEPKKLLQALKDPSWIEAMQEELLQFKLQKVWVLIDLPKGKRAIVSKWVFRNKKDERGIVIRNKDRLIAQGHTQEEGIDYDEVFSPVSMIAIRLFLAYASFMGFMVYQMDVKSAFIYGTIEEEELCKAFDKLMKDKFQMSSMGELTFLLGLQVKQKEDGIFISQDKYVAKILRKFGFIDVKSASTSIETDKPLLKDLMAVVPTSSHEAEYVAATLKFYGFKISCWTMGVNTSRCDEDSIGFKELMVFIVPICVLRKMELELLLATTIVDKVNGNVQLQALIDDKKVVVTKAILRRDLHLDDADGVECLPNAKIFKELVRMGYEKPHPKLTFYKAFFSAQWKFLIHTIIQCISAKRTGWNEFSSFMASAVICLATSRKFNFLKYIFDNMIRNVDNSKEVVMDAESQERTNLNAASKGVSVVIAPELVSTVEPTIAQKLHDEEVQKVTARDEQERADMEKALELQRQLDEREDDIDWSVVDEQSTTRFRLCSSKIKMFKRKKRFADETLLQVSFNKLRAAKVLGSKSTQEIPTDDPKEITKEDVQNMLEIIPVPDFRVKALQVKYHIIDWEIHTEERFSSVEPIEDKERALWVELKRLFKSDANDVLWKLQRYMHAPLTWRLYSDFMILMLSGKLQVEKDTEMARDLVMKIFMEANRPRNRCV